jgi:hypothetical protein
MYMVSNLNPNTKILSWKLALIRATPLVHLSLPPGSVSALGRKNFRTNLEESFDGGSKQRTGAEKK